MFPPVDYVLAADAIKLASYFLKSGCSDAVTSPYRSHRDVIATAITMIYRRTIGASSVPTKDRRGPRAKRISIGNKREAAPLCEAPLGIEAPPTPQAMRTKHLVEKEEDDGSLLDADLSRLPYTISEPVDTNTTPESSGLIVLGVGQNLAEEPTVEPVYDKKSTKPNCAYLGDQNMENPDREPVLKHIDCNGPLGEAVGDGHGAVAQGEDDKEETNGPEEQRDILYDPKPELDKLGALLCFVRVQGGRASLLYLDRGDPGVPPARPEAVYRAPNGAFGNNPRAYVPKKPSPLQKEVISSDVTNSEFSRQWDEIMATNFGDDEDE